VTAYVVDASVAVKWFVPEELTEEALSYLSDEHELLAPDLLWPEFANIVWKKVRRGELTPDEARRILSLCQQVAFEVTASTNLIDSALEIALGLGRTVYDSMYLALAAHRDCVMLTADRRLFNAVNSSELSGHIAHLDESL
jgi:predicted nucleic acid-binding protein